MKVGEIVENFIIYLAGRIKGLSESDQNTWRRYSQQYFDRTNHMQDNYRVVSLNPNDYFSYYDSKHKTQKQVKQYYMSIIDRSNVVLVNLNGSMYSIGTAQEIQRAIDKDIPVIGFGTDDMYPWLVDDCQAVFDEVDEALDYIRDYYITIK